MKHRHYDMSDDPALWGRERTEYIRALFPVAFDLYRTHSTPVSQFSQDALDNLTYIKIWPCNLENN